MSWRLHSLWCQANRKEFDSRQLEIPEQKTVLNNNNSNDDSNDDDKDDDDDDDDDDDNNGQVFLSAHYDVANGSMH